MDTTAGRWKDAGGGNGIVPFDEPSRASPKLRQRTSFTEPVGSHPTPPSASSAGINTSPAVHYYTGKQLSSNPIKRVLWRNFTLRGLLDRLLRKTIKRNTWIYVSVRFEAITHYAFEIDHWDWLQRTKTVRGTNNPHLQDSDDATIVNIFIGTKGKLYFSFVEGINVALSVCDSRSRVISALIFPWRWPSHLRWANFGQRRSNPHFVASFWSLQVRIDPHDDPYHTLS